MNRFTETLTGRPLSRLLNAILYVGAGITHFTDTATYVSYMPPFLPWHTQLVYVAGVAAIVGGLGLIVKPLRRTAGAWLVLFLLAVLPANVYIVFQNQQLPWILLASARVLLQFVLILWVAWAAGLRMPRPAPSTPASRSPAP